MNRDVVIVPEGKSEIVFLRGVFQRLGAEPVFHSPSGGETGTAMTDLHRVLTEDPFTSEPALLREYRRRLDSSRGRIPGLRIFTVVDYDGHNADVRPYITGNLLKDVPLAEYVVPILNHPNLDAVMQSMGYGEVVGRKTDYYQGVVRGLMRSSDVLDLYRRLRSCDHTNLDVLLYHVMSHHPQFQSRIEAPREKDWAFL